MKKLTAYLTEAKPVSLFAAMLLLFVYLADMRRYIFDDINATLTLIRLGSEYLSVSALLPILLAAGILIGAGAVYWMRKRVRPKLVTALYGASGLFAAIALFFTPYHLQLLMPAQNLQNITSINLIAIIVFATVDVALFTAAIGTHLLSLSASKGLRGFALVTVCSLSAATLALLTAFLNWSFVICAGVYAGTLITANAADWIFRKDETERTLVARTATKTLLPTLGVALAAATAILIGGYFITEQAILL